MTPSREDAIALLEEWNQSASLRNHGLLVEACVRGYAADDGITGERLEQWGIAGLLHDLDYERFPAPETHGAIGADELERRSYPQEVVHAVRSHNDALEVPRTSRLDHLVYACDELAGFLVAVALMRPSRRMADVEPANVRKRMKDRAFARAVRREDITGGAALLGLDLDEHIDTCIRALQAIHQELGL